MCKTTSAITGEQTLPSPAWDLPYVIHPLDDVPEEKRSPDGLSTMRLSPVQTVVLLGLRSYIVVMLVLVASKMMTLAGWLHLRLG